MSLVLKDGDMAVGVIKATGFKCKSSGIPLVVEGDIVLPHGMHITQVMKHSKQKLRIGGKWACVVGDLATCGDVGQGFSKVNI